MITLVALAALFSTFASPSPDQARAAEPRGSAGPVLEIRSYNLKPGMRDEFQALVVREAIPLLRKWKVDVVAHGPSRHDADSYFLMRAFASLEDREREEEAFYGSDEWNTGPREAVLDAIETYTTVVVRIDQATLAQLRRAMTPEGSPSDVDELIKLNDAYVEAVKTSDAHRFTELLADDFLCSLPDGSIINRAAFLEQASRPPTVTNLVVDDLNVRLLGDVAIVHARTSFTLPDGTPGSGRYTDVWAKRQGRWVAVAAHVTRK